MKSAALSDFPGETLSIEEAAEVLGWGKRRAYQAAKDGNLPILVGCGERFRRVPKHALRQLLERGTWEGRRPPRGHAPDLQVVTGGE